MSNIDCLLDADPGLLTLSVSDKLTTINRNIIAGNGLTGGGLLNDGHITIDAVTPDTIDLTTSNDATLHTHAITTSSSPGVSAAILATDSSGRIDLSLLGVTDTLYSQEAEFDGDVLFRGGAGSDPYTAEITGWHITVGGDADFRNIYADGMNVGTFITDNILATAGTEILTKSLGILAADFTVAGTVNIIVYDLAGTPNTPVFSDGDTIRVQRVERNGTVTVEDIIGTVSSYVDLPDGEQQWTLTKSVGTNGTTVYAGSTVLDYGVSGDGFILSTALGIDPPYIDIRKWATTITNDTTYSRYGYLNAITGIDEYGLYSGISATQQIVASDQRIELKGAALSLYDGATEVVKIDPSTLSIALGNPLPGFGDEGIWFGEDSGSYKARIGSATDYFLWDGSLLTVAGKLLVDDDSEFTGVVTIGTNGGLWQGSGTFAAPTDALKIWNDSGVGRLATYNNGDVQVEFDTSGQLLAGAGAVILNDNGISIQTDDSVSIADQNILKWVDGATSHFEIAAYYDGVASPSNAFGSAQVIGPTGNAHLSLSALSGSLTDEARVTLFAQVPADTNNAYFNIINNAGGNNASTLNVDVFTVESATGVTTGVTMSVGGSLTVHQALAANQGLTVTQTLTANSNILGSGDIETTAGIAAGITSQNPGAGEIMYTGALRPRKNSTNYTAYAVVPLTTPVLVDSGTKSTSTNITLTGVPSNVKAVLLYAKQTTATAGRTLAYGPSSGNTPVVARTQVAGTAVEGYGLVPTSGTNQLWRFCSGTINNITTYVYGYII